MAIAAAWRHGVEMVEAQTACRELPQATGSTSIDRLWPRPPSRIMCSNSLRASASFSHADVESTVWNELGKLEYATRESSMAVGSNSRWLGHDAIMMSSTSS